MKKFKLLLPIILSIFIIGRNSGEKSVQSKIEETQNPSESKDNKDVHESKDTSTINKSAEDKTSSNKTEDRNEGSNSASKISIDVKTVDKTSTFPFGMSKDNVMLKLKDLKLEVINETEITSREDNPEWGNKVVSIDGISFSFDKSNQLYAINVLDKISTSLDLKKGDSLEKAENLYGKNHNKYTTENGFVFEYTFDDHYFRVFIEGDKVSHWAVSKYKFIK